MISTQRPMLQNRITAYKETGQLIRLCPSETGVSESQRRADTRRSTATGGGSVRGWPAPAALRAGCRWLLARPRLKSSNRDSWPTATARRRSQSAPRPGLRALLCGHALGPRRCSSWFRVPRRARRRTASKTPLVRGSQARCKRQSHRGRARLASNRGTCRRQSSGGHTAGSSSADTPLSNCSVVGHCCARNGVACRVLSTVGDFSALPNIAQQRVRSYLRVYSAVTIKPLYKHKRYQNERHGKQRTGTES